MRGNGLTRVRASTAFEFFTKLLRLRCGRDLAKWRKRLVWPPVAEPSASEEPRASTGRVH